jgi:hypothetical protein
MDQIRIWVQEGILTLVYRESLEDYFRWFSRGRGQCGAAALRNKDLEAYSQEARSETLKERANGRPQVHQPSVSPLLAKSADFGEGLLNRVEILGIRGQAEQTWRHWLEWLALHVPLCGRLDCPSPQYRPGARGC